MLLNCGVGEDSWRVPRTARRLNQSILKEISPEYSFEGLMLKLKLQSFGHLMWRTDSFEKILMLGKIEVKSRRGRQRMRWLEASPTRGTWVWASSRSWCWTEKSGLLQSIRLQRVGHDWVTELMPNLSISKWWQPPSIWFMEQCLLSPSQMGSMAYSPSTPPTPILAAIHDHAPRPAKCHGRCFHQSASKSMPTIPSSSLLVATHDS